jgi:hypothetical protein
MSSKLRVVRAVRRPQDESDESDEVQLDDLDAGIEAFTVASELWRLADPAKAARLDAIVERVGQRPGMSFRFEREDCLDIAEVLPGLDQALVDRGVVAPTTWYVDDAKAAEYAAQLPTVAREYSYSEPKALLTNGILTVRDLGILFDRAIAEHADVVVG